MGAPEFRQGARARPEHEDALAGLGETLLGSVIKLPCAPSAVFWSWVS